MHCRSALSGGWVWPWVRARRWWWRRRGRTFTINDQQRSTILIGIESVQLRQSDFSAECIRSEIEIEFLLFFCKCSRVVVLTGVMLMSWERVEQMKVLLNCDSTINWKLSRGCLTLERIYWVFRTRINT